MTKTVLKWWDIRSGNNYQHRIQVKQLPGSAHWSITKDSRGDGGLWTHDWAYEATSRPEVTVND